MSKHKRQALQRSFLLLLLSFGLPLAANDSLSERMLPVLKSHCLRCHGSGDEISGEVDFTLIKDTESLTRNPELIRDLIKVIEDREMPPEDESPELNDDDRKELVQLLEGFLHEALANPSALGQAPIRRMNRFQYNNAVIDLFGLKCIVFTLPERMMREHKNYFRPETGEMAKTVLVGSRPLGKSQLIEPRLAGVAAFPQDLRAEHGFDNRGDHLSMSPLLMESFLKLGQSIVASPDFRPNRVGVWNELFAKPKQMLSARVEIDNRLAKLLPRAFRRPVSKATRNRYTEFALSQIGKGAEFTDAMKSVAAAIISSPKFLYLYDQSTGDKNVQPLDDFELASRLSFFLWGSIPDGELTELAKEKELSKTNVLLEQVDRMLRDKRAKRFCDSFPSQWLQLERVISSIPNRDQFPGFYFSKYRDSMHMMLEPLLLFETVLIENRPITDLIDPDFTYRSPLLESAYNEKIPPGSKKRQNGGVGVLKFARIPIKDRRYGGVITNAAVMTMTSGSERTKPITRGAWLATVIFNDPPEPPPADVPPLSEKPPEEEKNLTLRERLKMHRERADCRGCHEQIDPLGFALENYDPIGVWRDQYENGREIDTAGMLLRQHKFTNVVEFKDAILAERDRFTAGLASHLMSFALARKIDAGDSVAIKQIAKATAADNYKIHTLLKQIVISDPFRHKRNPRKADDDN